jgi:hypothetical protein
MRVIVVLVLGGVAVTGCGGGAQPSPTSPSPSRSVPASAIALVGARPVPRAALDAALAQSRRAYAARGRAFPAAGTPAFARLRALAVALVVERSRLEVEAESAGIRITRADVDRRLEEVKRTRFGGSEQRYREGLRRAGLTDADIRADLGSQLLAAALRGVPHATPKVVYAKGFAPPNTG